jgi:hypothetical protein
MDVVFSGIEFRKTKQVEITLIAAAFKAILTVPKANAGIPGGQLYTGNIPFFLFLRHMSSHSHTKKVRSRSYAPKNANSDCCHTN